MNNQNEVENIPEQATFEPAQNAPLDVASMIDCVVARSEATQIFVNIINAFLNVRQNSDNKLTDEEILAIQNAINQESAKTDAMFEACNAAMQNQVATPEVSIKQISEETPSN